MTKQEVIKQIRLKGTNKFCFRRHLTRESCYGSRRKGDQRTSRECYICHKLGHYARECADKISDLQGKSKDTCSDEKGLRKDPLSYRGPASQRKVMLDVTSQK